MKKSERILQKIFNKVSQLLIEKSSKIEQESLFVKIPKTLNNAITILLNTFVEIFVKTYMRKWNSE